MVLAIGGAGVDLEKVQVHPTGLVDPNEPDAKVKFLAAEALRGCGGLLLDNEGHRLADELGHRDYVTGQVHFFLLGFAAMVSDAVVSLQMWKNGKYPIRLILNGEASKEIEWHCKHYVGRGLMKKIEGRAALAKEMNLPESKLKETFGDYVQIAEGKKKDPFGKSKSASSRGISQALTVICRVLPQL